MAEIARRELIQGAAALGAALALRSQGTAQTLPHAQAQYVFFTPAEAKFVEAAVDRLIPPEPEWAGARQAGVVTYIDLQLAGPYGQGDRLYLQGPIKAGLPGQGYQLGLTPARLYRRALEVIIGDLEKRGVDFGAAPGEEQDAFLKRLEAGEQRIDDFPSSIFFETLLANTVEGYFADPIYGGNRDMVSWRMIGFPGAYAAYLDLYTRHGLRYDREPISIAGAHHHHGGHGDGHSRRSHR